MKVVILAGGYGTRIRDVADDIPKPMIKIGPYPILLHIMKRYASYGMTDFIICLGYKGETIKDFFLNYESHTRDFSITLGSSPKIEYLNNHDELGWKVSLVDTGIHSMTGSRLAKIQHLLGQDDFMFTYGDGVSDVNINKLLAYHKSHGKILTVTGTRPPGRFGEIDSDPDGRVLGFNEKPQTTSGRVSGGFFVANSKLFDYLSKREDLVFEQEPIRSLVNDNQLRMFCHDGFWQPMDTSRDYQFLTKLYESGEAPWII
ncbi:MAG: hypothetical protein RLZ10_1486 [Bacteroidota bacterium]|jgi:glucose-1-phosphate cytidylyltransferase